MTELLKPSTKTLSKPRTEVQTEAQIFPFAFPDEQTLKVPAQKHVSVLTLLIKALEEKARVPETAVVIVVQQHTETPINIKNRKSVQIAAGKEINQLKALCKSQSVTWDISREGAQIKGEEATFALVKSDPKKSAEKIARPKILTPQRANGTSKETSKPNDDDLKDEKPRISNFRTREEKIVEGNQAIVSFTIVVLSSFAAEKFSDLNHDPRELLRRLPNGEHILTIFPKNRQKLIDELVDGFELILKNVAQKLRENNKLSPEELNDKLSPQEKKILILSQTIVKNYLKKHPENKFSDMIPLSTQLREHLLSDLTSSPAPESPKAPVLS